MSDEVLIMQECPQGVVALKERKLSFWSFFRESGSVPLDKLLEQLENEEKATEGEKTGGKSVTTKEDAVACKDRQELKKGRSFFSRMSVKRTPSKTNVAKASSDEEEKSDES